MKYLNVNAKGLNGRPHPALQGVNLTKNVQKMRSHIKMLSATSILLKSNLNIKVGPQSVDCAQVTTMKKHTTKISHIY